MSIEAAVARIMELQRMLQPPASAPAPASTPATTFSAALAGATAPVAAAASSQRSIRSRKAVERGQRAGLWAPRLDRWQAVGRSMTA